MPGLYVVEAAADFATIDRELRRLDDRLILTYELEPDKRLPQVQRRVYRVLCEVAGDRPPALLCDWRDPWGAPLPLSSGLVEQVRSQRSELVDYAAVNEAKKQAEIAEFENEVDEIAEDLGPRIAGKRSAVLPRGQHLRRSRDAQRRRGENV